MVMESAELCVLPGLGQAWGWGAPVPPPSKQLVELMDVTGCHSGEVTHVLHGPTFTSPHHCPHGGGRRGLVVEPQLVCSNSPNHCGCADEVGAPPVPGLRGDSRPGRGLGKASALLTQQLFMLTQQCSLTLGPCAGMGTHTPLGPAHSSGGTELLGTSPTTPKVAPPCRARDLQRC